MKKVAVECRHIRLAYGSTEVLKDVSLVIEPGEFFALLGPSGSGKSTLLRLIAGFNRQQQGQVLIDGADIGNLPPAQRNIGMVFQSYALWPHLSVWDNVAFGLVERRMDKATIKSKVGAALDLVNLSAYGERRPNQLSGGQQQRVALARTIVIEPQVLLLDEPLSNLDRNLRVQMREELLALQRRLGLTTIFVTHDQEEAMGTADRMAVLDGGVLQQVGTPGELYDFPVNPFVAGFVGTMNLLVVQVRGRGEGGWRLAVEGVAEEFSLSSVPANMAAAMADRMRLSFRPHSLRMVGVRDGAVAAPDAYLVWLPGRIEMSEFLGAFTRYSVRVGSQNLLLDQPHCVGQAKSRVDDEVRVGIDFSQVSVFGVDYAQ